MAASTSEKTRRLKKKPTSKKSTWFSNIFDTKAVGEVDYTFLFVVILVLAVGLVMLLSASAPTASEEKESAYYYFIRQLCFAAIGLIGMWICSHINYKNYIKWTRIAFIVTVILLILVAIPGIGKKVNGSRRWLGFFQPSEIAKPVIVLAVAKRIVSEKYDVKVLKGLLPFLTVSLWIAIPLLFEPHLSATMIILLIVIVMLWVEGMPIWPVIVAGVPTCFLGFQVIKLFSANRYSRLMRFTSPFEDLRESGYQISQSLYSIGSGKMFGLGLGESMQKYGFLPEPYNDFIFAIICEELGFVGATLVVLLFAALIIFGMRIAMNAPDKYSTMIAIGIVSQLAIQTVMNIAVATSSFPNTGVSLPFFSYGGTSLMTLLCEMGILLNISRHSSKL